jgi:hypothetical protein
MLIVIPGVKVRVVLGVDVNEDHQQRCTLFLYHGLLLLWGNLIFDNSNDTHRKTPRQTRRIEIREIAS